jgi:hypothetical protein
VGNEIAHDPLQLPDNWNRESHVMQKDAFGVFNILVPAVNGQPAIPHNSKVKVSSTSAFEMTREISLLIELMGLDFNDAIRYRRKNRAHSSVDHVSLAVLERSLINADTSLFDGHEQASHAGSVCVAHIRRDILESSSEVCIQEQTTKSASSSSSLRSAWSVMFPCCASIQRSYRSLRLVGISTPDKRIGTYKEFTKDLLPRIKTLGYNTIQLM